MLLVVMESRMAAAVAVVVVAARRCLPVNFVVGGAEWELRWRLLLLR